MSSTSESNSSRQSQQSSEHEGDNMMIISDSLSSPHEHQENVANPSAMIYALHNGVAAANVEVFELPITRNDLFAFFSVGIDEGKRISDMRLFKVNDFYAANYQNVNISEEEQEREEISDDQEIEDEGIYECHLTITDIPKKRTFDDVVADQTSSNSTKEPLICEICRGEVEDPTHFCTAESNNHPFFCAACIIAYIDNKVDSAFMGSCPVISCPSAFHQNKKKIIPYHVWTAHVSLTTSRQYSSLAASLLKFQCSNCHVPSTLDLGHEANRSLSCYTHLQSEINEEYGSLDKYNEFEAWVKEYCEGDRSLEEIYTYINTELFPDLMNGKDEDAWATFSCILKTIADPERRCNLHLRYLRDHPRIRTLCCHREHCFRCKTKGFHHNKTCIETTETLDHSVVMCPSCGIALARGDGCDTLTCLCGKQFSWTNEKRLNEKCNQFLQMFGHDHALSSCVLVLCDPRESWEEGVRQAAKAFQTRNRIEVNRALTDWFKKKYSPYPSQCCTVLPVDTLADGVREAIDLWKNTHVAEVTKRKEENETALRSIFTNMVTDERDRPVMAYRLTNSSRRSLIGNVDEKLVQSAMKWIEKHRGVYTKGVEEYEERSARQFLYLYGNKSIDSVIASDYDFPQVHNWSLDISNHYLTYGNDEASVRRDGNVSSRPAANARIGHNRATARIFIEEASSTPSLLSVGLSHQPIPVADAEGVGMRRESWGFMQDSATSSNYCTVMESGRSVEKIRKLIKGDVITISVDVNEGWCEIMLNESEHKHLFKIPTATSEEYFFCANVAVNHKLTLLTEKAVKQPQAPVKSEAISTTETTENAEDAVKTSDTAEVPTQVETRKEIEDAPRKTKLNECHTTMYHTLKKFLRKIMQDCLDDEENQYLQLSTSSANSLPAEKAHPLQTTGDEWLKTCDNDSRLAYEHFESIQPAILDCLGLKNRYLRNTSSATTDASDKESPIHLTFNMMLDAISWYNHHQNQIKSEVRTEMGLNFMLIHGQNAPFIAASNTAEFHSHRVDSADRLASVAYMHMFPEEMNAWYDYNATMRDPIVPNIARGCACLPRHLRSCPNAKRNFA